MELSAATWIAEDGRRAKSRPLEANLRLVVSLARRYAGRDRLIPVRNFGSSDQDQDRHLERTVLPPTPASSLPAAG
jgi:hypothetical protein